jgi:protein TonB
MFETVVPERVSPRSRKLFYEMLPLSLTIHACAAAAMVISASWEVAFPAHSPKLYAAFAFSDTPPPPPPPPPPPVTRTQPIEHVRAVVARMPEVAPTIIPDEIPIVEDVIEATYVAEPVAPPGAQVGGVAGGVEDGELGGDVGGTVGSVAPPSPPIVQVQRDAPLPVGSIDQEYPVYPDFYLKRGIQDSLVVRYLIGKDGRVKDVSVIRPPEHEDFAREAISKIRHWRFHPYVDEHGAPKEVSHELTVVFKIAKRRP